MKRKYAIIGLVAAISLMSIALVQAAPDLPSGTLTTVNGFVIEWKIISPNYEITKVNSFTVNYDGGSQELTIKEVSFDGANTYITLVPKEVGKFVGSLTKLQRDGATPVVVVLARPNGGGTIETYQVSAVGFRIGRGR
jgi:hypothetical protein